MRHFGPTQSRDVESRRSETPSGEPARVVDKLSTLRTAWRFRPTRSLILFGISLIAVIAVCTAVFILGSRDRDLANSERELKNTAQVLAEHTNQMIQSLELVQDSIIERMQSLGINSSEELERRMSGEDVHLRFKQQIKGARHINSMSLANSDGALINVSDSWPISHFNVADREYFKALKSNPDLTSFVSTPAPNQATGTWTIFIARKVSASNGEFLGVLIGSIETQYFESLFKKVALQNDGSISLIRRDGILLARYPHIDASIKSFAANPLFSSLLENANSRAVRLTSLADGKDRLIAAHFLPDYPIVVAVGTTISAAFASWKREAIYMIGTALMIGLASGGIVILITQQLVRRNYRSEQKLRAKTQQIDMALNNISQGLAMFDSSARLIVCNQRYLEMYGLSPEVVRPGCTLRELLNHRMATGTFFTDDPEQYINDLLDAVRKKNTVPKTLSMRDGRTITLINRPTPNGGWVATHEDITDKVKGEKDKEEQKRQNEIALSSMLQGICMFDAEQRLVVCNKRFADLYGLSDEQTKPGTPLRKILQYRAAAGNVPEDHEHYIAGRLSKISMDLRQFFVRFEFSRNRWTRSVSGSTVGYIGKTQ